MKKLSKEKQQVNIDLMNYFKQVSKSRNIDNETLNINLMNYFKNRTIKPTFDFSTINLD